jgi:glutamate-1-semialdehyde 2,1-aminomutase
MLTVFFTDLEVVDFATAKTADTLRFNQHFHAMLEQGVYLAPSQFEAVFISAAHTLEDIDYTIRAAGN